MPEITCPMCCQEKFGSHSALKAHIEKILRNLSCSLCSVKFQNLNDFTKHLNDKCKEIITSDGDDSKGTENSDSDMIFKKGHSSNGEDENNEQPTASDLSIDPLQTTKPEPEDKTAGEDAGEYFCEMCEVHFDDVNQHLELFHEGHEVVLEDNAVEAKNESAVPLEEIFILNSESTDEDGNDNLIEEEADDADEDSDNLIELERLANNTNKTNTIVEQNITDRDGRLYTRKFVKIDKFWLPQNTPNAATLKEPILQKFIVTDGEVTMITDEDVDKVEDKSTIIEINQCPDCSLLFPVLENYLKHKCSSTLKFDCSQCTSQFADAEALKEHSKLHAKKTQKNKSHTGPFHCEECNTTLATFKSLRLHKRMHDPIKSREVDAPVSYGLDSEVAPEDVDNKKLRQMFICKICNKTYDKQYEQIHVNSHNSNNGFNCEVCNRKFHTAANLEMHMKAHSNNKKFACSYCRKPFVTYDALNDHLANQCQKRAYACQFCGRRFSRPHEKVKHERIHTGEKPHVCEICGKAFRVSYCLTLHLRTHSGTRPYQCQHCSKRFKSHSVYNHHLLTHSDVRNYKCPYCPKAFKTSVQLAGHKNSHIKPFTCTQCNRPFASLYAVRAHMETHKRDNNLKYECWMCGALYSRTFALRDHLREQHQEMGEKAKVVLSVDEEIDAANSILVKEDDDIILGLENNSTIEIIENE